MSHELLVNVHYILCLDPARQIKALLTNCRSITENLKPSQNYLSVDPIIKLLKQGSWGRPKQVKRNRNTEMTKPVIIIES